MSRVDATTGILFGYRDEAESVEHEGVRVARLRWSLDSFRAGSFAALQVEGFDESTAIARLLINGRRVPLEALDDQGGVLAPLAEQWRVGTGTRIEVLMRGQFLRVNLIVGYDPVVASVAAPQVES